MRQSALPSRMGVGLFACFACALTATVAEAQPAGGPPPGEGRSASQQLNLRRDELGGADGEAARGKARAGDCAGALPLFDSALRTAVEPTLRRDRGLCHEKLGHPFPAMEDYRAYLTARPDAPDAEQVRQRLHALEDQAGGDSAGSRAWHDDDPEGLRGGASASVAVGTRGARASASSSSTGSGSSVIGPKPGEPERDFDYYVQQERLRDAAASSPLRYGSGLVLGPFVHVPRFFIGEKADSSEVAYGFGAALRYSTGPLLSLVSELGYGGIGTSGESTSKSGPLLMAGLELRLAISKLAGDHLLLRGGLGYERYVVSGTRAITSNLLGRFAFGYRHVFGPSVGLELLADGGPALVIPESGSAYLNGVIGGSFAFVVGF